MNEMWGPSRSSVLSIIVLVGACSPRTARVDTVTNAPVSSDPSPRAPVPSAAKPVDEAPDEQAAALCETAFSDQRQLYVDAELEVHPDHAAVFLEYCRKLPLSLQRCASPLYQIDHERECEVARDEADPASMDAWLRMFDVLSRPDDHLRNPLPREAATE